MIESAGKFDLKGTVETGRDMGRPYCQNELGESNPYEMRGETPRDNVVGAVSNLLEGYTCSEAILGAYASALGLPRETAVKISGGFGGGMAQGKTCGAVTGAYMVLGLKYASGKPGGGYSRDRTYQLVQEFAHRFRERRGTTECRELLRENGVDMTRSNLSEELRKSGLCVEMVRDAAEIIESIFLEED